MFFKKDLIFTLLFSLNFVSNLYASSRTIPIKLVTQNDLEEITEQTMWVDEYRALDDENLEGKHEFTVFLSDKNKEIKVKNILVRLRNEWFNLVSNYRPEYEPRASECRFSLHHFGWNK